MGNREAGSQSFDQHLTELFGKQIIDVAEAKRLASNVDALNLALRASATAIRACDDLLIVWSKADERGAACGR